MFLIVQFAVPATSAPSERVFSVASMLISKKRARLDPGMAGIMLYLSENWNWWDSKDNFMKLYGKKDGKKAG